MTEPIPYATPGLPRPFAGRKTGLTVFGILMIVMGALAGCGALVTPMVLVMPQPPGQPRLEPRAIISAVILYAVLSTALIWGGVGSIQARRWIRPMVIVLATLLIVGGLFGLVLIVASAPAMLRVIRSAGPAPATGMAVPQAAYTVGIVIGIGFALLIYVIIPGVYLLFYRSDVVRQTLEFYDPRPRWTDGCPLPVLGMNVACVLLATFCLVSMAHPVAPLFGVVLSGATAAPILLLVAGGFAMAAVLIYRRRVDGWNLGVGLYVLMQVSILVTVLRVGMPALAAATGTAESQIQQMRDSLAWNPAFFTATSLLFLIGVVFYALYARRFFGPQAAAEATASTQ